MKLKKYENIINKWNKLNQAKENWYSLKSYSEEKKAAVYFLKNITTVQLK